MSDPWCRAEIHGSRYAYRHGCRCSSARRRVAEHQQVMRGKAPAPSPALVDARLTKLRLRALHAIGWRWSDIERFAGHDRRWWCRIANGYHEQVHRRTEEEVELLYEQLSTAPGSDKRSVTDSRRRGWVPPWVLNNLRPDQLDNPPRLPPLAEWIKTNPRCKAGHDRDEKNTRIGAGRPGQFRLNCLTCKNLRQAKYKERGDRGLQNRRR